MTIEYECPCGNNTFFLRPPGGKFGSLIEIICTKCNYHATTLPYLQKGQAAVHE